LEVAEGCDEVNEAVGLSVVSVEEYLSGVYYLYWENRDVLKKKLASAERDLSAFELIPITREIAVKAAEVDADLIKKGGGVEFSRRINRGYSHKPQPSIVNAEY